MAPQLTALIMAAGQGTRMRSSLPKVLHPVCGVPMVEWVIDAARAAGADRVVCITRPGSGVAEALPGSAEAADQDPDRDGEGTGAAILAARSQIEQSDRVLILSGDVPLTSAELIEGLLAEHEREGAAATLLTTDKLDPTAYGRIVRESEDGDVERIVETKSEEGVDEEVLALREINIGTYVFEAKALLEALDEVEVEDNGERYLTSVFPILRERDLKIAAHRTDDTLSAMGVNNRADLMEVTRHAQRRILATHARGGVTFSAPDSVAVDANVQIGEDTTIAAGVTLKSGTKIGERCQIGPQTTISGCEIGDEVTIPHSFLVDCRVAGNATIGPFAYLRPEADVREGAKVGTFVEVKKSTIHAGAKVPHLSYIGDADIGADANLGAGTITANYHRGRKTRTTVGEGVHTGVHTALVAPVHVGDGAYTAAGSVITEDVPDGALAVSRPKDSQNNIEGYAERISSEEP
jgi:bifunctional UDP-N-acetylglucosamine pyrophosphorylase/glucosamine-1-phosphate N-acetyltransferase